MSAVRQCFSVDSWLRRGNVDESQSASVGSAASVSAAVNPVTDMGVPDTADEVSIRETETYVGLDAPISKTETLTTAEDYSVNETNSTSANEVPVPQPIKKKRKLSSSSGSYDNHKWISKTRDGYICTVCQEFGIKGLHEKGHGRGPGCLFHCHLVRVGSWVIRQPSMQIVHLIKPLWLLHALFVDQDP